MAYYLVTATPKDKMIELRGRLDEREFVDMNPFGEALTKSLENARYDEDKGKAVWEEEDYCSPPLRMERNAVLDDYFEDIEVKQVEKGDGWDEIKDLPSLWDVHG